MPKNDFSEILALNLNEWENIARLKFVINSQQIFSREFRWSDWNIERNEAKWVRVQSGAKSFSEKRVKLFCCKNPSFKWNLKWNS